MSSTQHWCTSHVHSGSHEYSGIKQTKKRLIWECALIYGNIKTTKLRNKCLQSRLTCKITSKIRHMHLKLCSSQSVPNPGLFVSLNYNFIIVFFYYCWPRRMCCVMQHIRLDYVCVSTTHLTVRGTLSHVENSSINRSPSLCTCHSGPHRPNSPQQQSFITGPCRGRKETAAHLCTSITHWSHFDPSFYLFQWEGWKVLRDLSTGHIKILLNTLPQSLFVNRISKALRSQTKTHCASGSELGGQITYQWRAQLRHKDYRSNYRKKRTMADSRAITTISAGMCRKNVRILRFSSKSPLPHIRIQNPSRLVQKSNGLTALISSAPLI